MGLGDLIAEMAKKYPKKDALIHGSRKVNYKELNQRTNRLANALLNELNVKKGDHIGILLYNCIEYMEIYIASYKCGAAGFGINYRDWYFDYAFLPYNILGASHHFSICMKF